MLRTIVNSDTLTFINKWSTSNPVRLYADIGAKEVYAPCDSVVMFIGKDIDNYQNVLLQICADVVINIKHIRDVQVQVGQIVKEKQLIGFAKKFCRIELGTLVRDESDDCIRIYDRMYYKRNPEHLTADNLGFVQFNHGDTQYVYSEDPLSDIIVLTKEQEIEYSQLEVQKLDE